MNFQIVTIRDSTPDFRCVINQAACTATCDASWSRRTSRRKTMTSQLHCFSFLISNKLRCMSYNFFFLYRCVLRKKHDFERLARCSSHQLEACPSIIAFVSTMCSVDANYNISHCFRKCDTLRKALIPHYTQDNMPVSHKKS